VDRARGRRACRHRRYRAGAGRTPEKVADEIEAWFEQTDVGRLEHAPSRFRPAISKTSPTCWAGTGAARPLQKTLTPRVRCVKKLFGAGAHGSRRRIGGGISIQRKGRRGGMIMIKLGEQSHGISRQRIA